VLGRVDVIYAAVGYLPQEQPRLAAIWGWPENAWPGEMHGSEPDRATRYDPSHLWGSGWLVTILPWRRLARRRPRIDRTWRGCGTGATSPRFREPRPDW